MTAARVIVTASSEHWAQIAQPANNRIQGWKIDRKDAKGAAWQLRAYNFNDSARFEVAAGKPVSLEVGEPMRAVMQIAGAEARARFESADQTGRFQSPLPGPIRRDACRS